MRNGGGGRKSRTGRISINKHSLWLHSARTMHVLQHLSVLLSYNTELFRLLYFQYIVQSSQSYSKEPVPMCVYRIYIFCNKKQETHWKTSHIQESCITLIVWTACLSRSNRHQDYGWRSVHVQSKYWIQCLLNSLDDVVAVIYVFENQCATLCATDMRNRYVQHHPTLTACYCCTCCALIAHICTTPGNPACPNWAVPPWAGFPNWVLHMLHMCIAHTCCTAVLHVFPVFALLTLTSRAIKR